MAFFLDAALSLLSRPARFWLVVGGLAALLGFLPGPLPATAQELVPVRQKQSISWGDIPDAPAPVELEEIEPLEPDGTPDNHAVPDLEELLAPGLETVGDGEETGITLNGRPTEIIRQRYPDGRVQVRRHVSQDEAGNFFNNGPWELYSPGGQVIARGEFDAGAMSGHWYRWHPAGSSELFLELPFNLFTGPWLSVCSFSNGKPDGVWTVYDRQRRKVLEVPYAGGLRHGKATWYWPGDGKMRQVEFVDGELHGDLIEWDRNNRVTRRASYEHNRERITRTSWYHPEQKRGEYRFLGPETRFAGEDDWWDARPAPIEVTGEEVRHGLSREWHRNGQLKMQGEFVNGQRQGVFIWWHENGLKQLEGPWLDDSRHGRWRWWHANGALAIEGHYDRETPVGIWTWFHEDGTLEHSENMDESPAPESLEAIAPEID